MDKARSCLSDCLSHGKGTKYFDKATALQAGLDKATSESSAIEALRAMNDGEFAQFQATGVCNDDGITDHTLQEVHKATLKRCLPNAIAKREEERKEKARIAEEAKQREAERLAVQEQQRQEAAEARRLKARAAELEARRRQDPVNYFGARELSLDMPRSEFLRLYKVVDGAAPSPASVSQNECTVMGDDKFGWSAYLIATKDEPYGVKAEFVDDAMLSLTLIYDHGSISDLGGLKALTKRVRDRFPNPDSELDMRFRMPGTDVEVDFGNAWLEWKMSKAGRKVTYQAIGGNPNSPTPPTAKLEAVDETVKASWQAKKEKVDPGF